MKLLLQYLSCKYNKIRTLFDELSKPNPKYAKDKLDQRINHRRIKAIFTFHLFIILLSFIQILLNTQDPLSNQIVILANTIMLLSSYVLKKYHQEAIKIFYNIIFSVIAIILANNGTSGVQRAWVMIPLYPTFLFWYTGSSRHFLIHTIIQFIYMKTFYRQKMIDSLNVTSTEEFVECLTSNSSKMLLFNLVIIYSIQTHLQKSYKTFYAVEKTQQEFEGQKTFLLGFSHELRNLLNSLMGNVKLASLEQLNDKSKEFLQNANLCGELLLHLVNNILDTGKSEIGDLEVNPIAISIYEPLEKIWHICAEIIRRKGLNGSMRIKKNVPVAMKIDCYRLTQVILNLVGNAVKFTDSGSIDISIEWIKNYSEVNERCFEPLPFNDQDEFSEGISEKQKCLSLLNTDDLLLNLKDKRINPFLMHRDAVVHQGILKIIVNDTGCGLSESNLSRLFQKFTQVSSDSSRRKLGTGLGLYITKQICEKMHGQIRAFSRESYGSCFIFCIPVETVASKNATIERISIGNIEQLQGLRAIVVDDESLSSMILKTFLTKFGINVIDVAPNGVEGFKKYSEHVERNAAPHIITMDLEMPIMNGKEAAERIREYEEINRLKPCLLIIISGNCSESEIAECLDVNGKIRANVFLKKPANAEELLQVILEHFRDLL